jgi:carboxylesterase
MIRLKGHGTRVQDLDNLGFIDFMRQVEEELKRSLDKKRDVVLVGYSFGAHLALILASKYPVKAVINMSIPLKKRLAFRFIFLIPKSLLGKNKYYKKKLGRVEKKYRKESFYYDKMHINAIAVVKRADKELKKNLHRIKVPCLSIHSTNESIGHWKSCHYIESKINSKIKESLIMKSDWHNLFHSPNEKRVEKAIEEFIVNNKVFKRGKK